MFTGIITDVTEVVSSRGDGQGTLIGFKKPKDWDNLTLGESVNTDGVCLTVSSLGSDTYKCHLMPETLTKTNFGKSIPTKVNLERALKIDGRLGGHFVQGHTDDIGKVVNIEKSKNWIVSIEFLPKYRTSVVYKGSIAINGVSLTVMEVKNNTLSVALVPYTLQHTTLGILKIGERVNLEFDMIGKYITAYMEVSSRAKS